MIVRQLLHDRLGNAAAEMALILPLLLALLYGSIEGGHFIWTQHKLVEAVRNGARFAGRLPIQELCDGETVIASQARIAEIKLMTRTGQTGSATAPALVPGWDDSEVGVAIACHAFVDTGIYSDLAQPGAVVTVTARSVPYPSLFGALGFINLDMRLGAKSSAPVIGI